MKERYEVCAQEIEIAACGTPKVYSQLTSPEAEHLIGLYWRIRKAAFDLKGLRPCMGLEDFEVRDGIRGWWVPR